ncbi:MAG: type II secretion system F family protein [Rickettsiales bacterium]|nr:type II secretion system F family protein [Rickettsiales bacterium]
MENLSLDIIIFGGVALFMGVVFLFIREKGDDNKVKNRIKRVHGQTLEEKIEEKALSLRRETDTSLNQYGLEDIGNRLSSRLQTAGLELTVRNYMLLCIGIAFFLFLAISIFLQKSLLLGLLVGFVLGFGIPHFYVNRRISQSKKSFLKLFPDAIELIVRGLRAGLPVTESMLAVAEEVAEPVSTVYREIGDQVKLGVPIEKAMSDMANNLKMTEFDFFVISVTLQRETGGNLGEILSNLADVLRQRHMLKLKIRAMSSEARASAMIVGALPFLVLTALMFVSPEYLTPLVDDYRGNMASIGALCSMGTGIFIMSRMAQFKI